MIELPLVFEPADDGFVGVFAELPLVLGHLRREFAFFVERVDQLDLFAAAYAVVVFTIGRGQVNHAGAVARLYEVVGQDTKRVGLVGKVRKQRLVRLPHQVATRECLQRLVKVGALVISRDAFGRRARSLCLSRASSMTS